MLQPSACLIFALLALAAHLPTAAAEDSRPPADITTAVSATGGRARAEPELASKGWSPTAVTPPATPAWELGELCSFYLDFEDTVVARFADGALEPTAVALEVDGKTAYLGGARKELVPYFVPGLRGKALSTTNGRTSLNVTFAAAKNFSSRQGTVLFWLRYDEKQPAGSGNLVFNAPGATYLNLPRQKHKDRIAETAIVWFATPPGAQTAHNGWMIVERPTPWPVGEWHQIALTWGLDELCYYEDGALRSRQAWESGRPMPENLAGQFTVSLAGWSERPHDTLSLDEFCVFPAALTAQLVQEEYKRLKP